MLSVKERAQWRLQRLMPHTGAWNHALAVHVFGGQLTVPTLTEALNQVIGHHPALRTRFPEVRGEPVAVVIPPEKVALEVPVRGMGHGLWRDELRAAAGRPFNLERDIPVRAALLRYGGIDTLVLVLHQLAGGAWAAGLIYHELAARYDALSTGAPVPPELTRPVDAPVEPPPSERAVAYWRDRLADFDPAQTALAIDRTDPPRPTFTGALLTQPLGPTAHNAVRDLAQRQRVTEDIVLLTAYCALLAFHGGGPDLAVGALVDARDLSNSTGAGARSQLLPIRTRIDLSGSFARLTASVRDSFLEAAAHPDVPWELVMPVPDPPGAGLRPPVFRHVYTCQSTSAAGYQPFAGLPARVAPVDTGHSRHDLDLAVDPTPGRITVRVAYRTDIFDADDVRALAQRYGTLLCQAAAAPDLPLAELSWWTSADRAIVAGAHRAGTRAFVQDEHGRRLPPGVRGELCLAGTGAARGYWRHDGGIERLGRPDHREVGRHGG